MDRERPTGRGAEEARVVGLVGTAVAEAEMTGEADACKEARAVAGGADRLGGAPPRARGPPDAMRLDPCRVGGGAGARSSAVSGETGRRLQTGRRPPWVDSPTAHTRCVDRVV